MNNYPLLRTIGLALIPVTAAAQSRIPKLPIEFMQAVAKGAGFADVNNIEAPKSPAGVPPSAPALAPVDESVKTALDALVDKSQLNYNLIGATAKKLGFHFVGDDLPNPPKFEIGKGLPEQVPGKDSDLTQPNPVTVRYFDVTADRADIVIAEVRRVEGKKKQFAYRISRSGVPAAEQYRLRAAVMTIMNPDQTYTAVEIPLKDAQAGYQGLLDFWVGYYLKNLKPAAVAIR
jgi:hypothetical protein